MARARGFTQPWVWRTVKPIATIVTRDRSAVIGGRDGALVVDVLDATLYLSPRG